MIGIGKGGVVMNSMNEIKKEDLINQFDLLKKSSNEAYNNQDYNSLFRLSIAMNELYKTFKAY